MHELGLCQSILDAVERRAMGRPVAKITVRMGALHMVDAAAFDQSFALVSEGSVADGAIADLVTVPVSGRSQSCGRSFEAGDALSVCPACGSFDVERSGGSDLVLESIEYRVDAGDGDEPQRRRTR